MGFGGAALAANQVIRTNRNLLKSKRNVGKLSSVASTNEKWIDPKKATFDQLMAIRTRIRHENKVRLYKITFLTVLGFVALILLLSLIPWDLIFTNTFNPYSH